MKMRKGITYGAFLVILALSITATCMAAPGAAATTNKGNAPAYKMASTTVPSSSSTGDVAKQPPKMMGGEKCGIPMMGDPMKALITLSGQTKEALVAAYPNMNPWQIANKLGKLEELKTAVLKDMRASLDALVASGKLTSAAADEKYTIMAKPISAITSATVDTLKQPMGGKEGNRGFEKGFAMVDPMQLLITISGKTQADLVAAYPQNTVWQMAQKLGVLDTLKAKFLADTKTALDTAVTNKKMTSDEETKIYTDLQARVAKIDGTSIVVLGNERGFGGPRGGCKGPKMDSKANTDLK